MSDLHVFIGTQHFKIEGLMDQQSADELIEAWKSIDGNEKIEFTKRNHNEDGTVDEDAVCLEKQCIEYIIIRRIAI